MSRICLLCQENETPDGHYKICDPCCDNAAEMSERNAELYAAIPKVLDAARAVIRAWESGDLAQAVRRLAAAVKDAEGR